MTKLNRWKMSGVVFALYALGTLTAQSQVFIFLTDLGGDPARMSLTQARDGFLYGTTYYSGAYGDGSILRITSAGKLTSVYSFCPQSGCLDGGDPDSGVIEGTDGNLYGTTQGGGSNGYGTIFELVRGGKLITLHSFAQGEGNHTQDVLVQAVDGAFYGTNEEGGPNNGGTVFRITNDGQFKVLYKFCDHSFPCTDGANPDAGLIQATDGNLYGTTAAGGTYDGGTVFRITATGTLTTLYSFCSPPNCTDGYAPVSALVQASDGSLLGTTEYGGNLSCLNSGTGCGTAFRITLTGQLTTVHVFCASGDCTDGSGPIARLIQATDGNFYGTTEGGGNCQCNDGAGTIFQITPTGVFTTLHSFDGTDGSLPGAKLTQDTDGIFYGVTSGELGEDGTTYSLDMGLGPFVTFVLPAGKVGQTGGILGQGLTGTTAVSLNGTPAEFKVVSDTYLTATVPPGATTGYVTVTTPTGVLTSNVPFRVIQ